MVRILDVTKSRQYAGRRENKHVLTCLAVNAPTGTIAGFVVEPASLTSTLTSRHLSLTVSLDVDDRGPTAFGERSFRERAQPDRLPRRAARESIHRGSAARNNSSAANPNKRFKFFAAVSFPIGRKGISLSVFRFETRLTERHVLCGRDNLIVAMDLGSRAETLQAVARIGVADARRCRQLAHKHKVASDRCVSDPVRPCERHVRDCVFANLDKLIRAGGGSPCYETLNGLDERGRTPCQMRGRLLGGEQGRPIVE